MTSKELRKKFLNFFEKKGHTIVPSSSLIPDDQSVLLTTAGMQQFVPYLSGEVKPPYEKACSVQKCFRVKDLDEVGDATHHTFFEMLGNWSFGDYFKKEAIEYALEFLKECGISKEKLAITIFKGEKGIARDDEAFNLWLQHFSEKDIFEFGMKDNFWGPTSKTGPCGPCSEIHYDKTGKSCGEKCGPNCSCGRYVEIWNLVFMEYLKNEEGYQPLPQKNIDTGIGFERLLAILNKKDSAYETDLFAGLMEKIEISDERLKRVFADHVRASCFLIADGVIPSNVEQGYVLRRLLRRVIGQERILGIDILKSLVEKVVEDYKDVYPELKTDIMKVVDEEEKKFGKTIEKGMKILNTEMAVGNRGEIEHRPDCSPIDKFAGFTPTDLTGKWFFNLYQTFGFPLELSLDILKRRKDINDVDLDKVRNEFEEAFKKHQELSRAGAEKKFGGHGLGETRVFEKGDEEKVKKLHTATHLLHQALENVLGSEVKQMGSDITPERLRFDFSYSQKMMPEQIKETEEIVNQKIKDDLTVKCEEMDKEKALKSGAKAFFKGKYGDKVKVYSIDSFSKEICAGPHVEKTGELGKFKITKEQSSSAGIRRIKAVLE